MAPRIEKIRPKEAHEHLESGDALLVCAYDDEEKFEKNHLEGAIPLRELAAQAEELPRDFELIFYCA